MIASKIFHNMEASTEMNKSRIELLDVVALTVDLPEYNLYCGQVGTVVELLASGAAFEVEFSDRTRIYARAMPAASSPLLSKRERAKYINTHGS